MASIHKDIPIDATADDVWDAVRDFGALHTRLVPGFVTDTKLDGDARIVTFANGNVARELLVGCDDDGGGWPMRSPPTNACQHYAGSVQVLADGATRSRLIWIVDVLPNEIAPYIYGADGSWRRWPCRRRWDAAPHDISLSRRARRGRPRGRPRRQDGSLRTLRRLLGSRRHAILRRRARAAPRRANGISAGRWKAAPSRTSGSCRRAANCAMATPPPTSIPTAPRCGSTIPISMPGASSGPIR